MLCVPSDSLALEARLNKRPRVENPGESHYNADFPTPGFSSSRRCSSSSECLPEPGSRYQEICLDSSSLDSSSVDSSPSPKEDEQSWEFRTILSFSCQTPQLLSRSSDVISTIDYDETGQLVATGGLARKIRICSYRELIQQDEDQEEAEGSRCRSLFTTICMPAKLSSLKWKPGGSEVIACGDYDGSVTEWDVEHGSSVSERYEHSGRTVWSVDYTPAGSLLASASSDSSVRLWSRNSERSVGMISAANRNSMCSVEFSRTMGSFLVGVACADTCAYVYDLRRLQAPVLELRGHLRSVSYTRWLGSDKLVTSSPDGTVRLWEVSSSAGRQVRCFDVHSNSRNFVGLSVVSLTASGLIASGSESNEVFVYGSSSGEPVFRHRFDDEQLVGDKDFVGSVCWTRQEDHYALISANSQGVLQNNSPLFFFFLAYRSNRIISWVKSENKLRVASHKR